ncbi:MAG: Asp-tRNA(Asn)/Glu-tRNA(Gln) amidotransferase subunit GatC [Candidatus Pacebacteria bacterium]|nr:Asp-tRNA(Asn)/Glu-tRNA(Gln) amidotransferase subunit GatC [Candidatus Paceibacterota bacterium]
MISKIAKLANLIVEDKKMEKDFSSILGYVDKLKEVDVSEIKETSNLSCSNNVFREDVEIRKDVTDLLNLMPEKENNYLKVNEVFEEND